MKAWIVGVAWLMAATPATAAKPAKPVKFVNVCGELFRANAILGSKRMIVH